MHWPDGILKVVFGCKKKKNDNPGETWLLSADQCLRLDPPWVEGERSDEE